MLNLLKQPNLALKILLALGIFSVVLCWPTQAAPQEGPQETVHDKMGTQAPALRVKKWVNHDDIRMEDLYGKVVAVLYWGSYQQGFHAYIPDFMDVVNTYKKEGVIFLGISSEPEKQLLKNIEELGLDIPLALDDGITTYSRFGFQEIPTLCLIDAKGNIAWANPPYPAFGYEEALEGFIKNDKKLIEKRLAYDTALEAVSSKKVAQGIKGLSAIISDKKGDERLKEMATQAKGRLEKQAQQQLAKIEGDIENGYFYSGLENMKTLTKDFSGTDTAKEAKKAYNALRKDKRYAPEKKAWDLLKKAKASLKKNKTKDADRILQSIIDNFADTEAGREAADLKGS